jgi:flagellar protein FliS
MIPTQTALSDSYLLQQITSATPEQLCILLLEGAQRFLLQAVEAAKARNIQEKARLVNRVSAIIEELMLQVDNNGENELALNLTRIYEWWMNQLFEASRLNLPDKMQMICTQMDDMKATWAQYTLRDTAAPKATGLGGDLMG